MHQRPTYTHKKITSTDINERTLTGLHEVVSIYIGTPLTTQHHQDLLIEPE